MPLDHSLRIALAALLLSLTVGCLGEGLRDDDDSAVDDSTDDDDSTGDDDDSAGDDDDDSAKDPSTDRDGDGYGEEIDCNDQDPAINPGADELCDHVDNDCDGAVDEPDAVAAPTWYEDVDGDGYGLSTSTEEACGQPHGYSAHPGDCDDDDPAFHPGATEADCSDPADYNCDGAVAYLDADSDNHAACDDCDDSNPAINSDATEACNSLDDDCDGQIDEAGATGESPWYPDLDGDSSGGTSPVLSACAAPPGYVSGSGDCDDLDASSYPGAVEICDGADNNCDNTIDEGVEITFYGDSDGDGFGDLFSPVLACALPPGASANSLDCDDTAASTSPAAFEICDEVDNDCDTGVDEGVTTTYYADSDGDGYGAASGPLAACTLPSGASIDSSDCDDSQNVVYPGANEVCDGLDNDCNGDVDEADSGLDQSSYLVWYLDGDLDGYGEPTATLLACSQPPGYVANDSDCDDSDPNASPASAWYDDDDGDGYGNPNAMTSACVQPAGTVSDATDCDDSDADIHPATQWFEDADGDTFGNGANSQASCTQPAGYVSNSIDCDDQDPNSGSCFQQVQFSTCSATGPNGPSQSDCDNSYSGTSLAGIVSVNNGKQSWTVPTSGNYTIEAAGADGGDNTGHSHLGGYGAAMLGTFALTAGDVIDIVVGQSGEDGNDDAGGGGGSFVVLQAAGTLLIGAGGGGGAGENDDDTTNMALYKNGVTSSCGQNAPSHSNPGSPTQGGCNGAGGAVDFHLYGQGGGGGFSGNGAGPGGGNAYVNGAAGSTRGGFGGGGNGGGDGGGGGGGYSGGASGSGGGSPDGPGGGGGSFNGGTSQSNTSGDNNGPGYVVITSA